MSETPMTGRLTPRQRRFVEEYVVDFNISAAAKRAGFRGTKARMAGYGILKAAVVRQAIEAWIEERASETRAEEIRLIGELRRIAYARLTDVVDWGVGDDGKGYVTVKAAAELSGDEAAAVAEVALGPGGVVKVKMHDKQAALTALGRRLDVIAQRFGGADGSAGPAGPSGLGAGETAAALASDLAALSPAAREKIRAVLLEDAGVTVPAAERPEE